MLMVDVFLLIDNTHNTRYSVSMRKDQTVQCLSPGGLLTSYSLLQLLKNTQHNVKKCVNLRFLHFT